LRILPRLIGKHLDARRFERVLRREYYQTMILPSCIGTIRWSSLDRFKVVSWQL
jgi:hypothetical protein